MGNEVIKQATFEKTLADSVLNRVKELSQAGRLDLPQGYSIGNALNSAWLKIIETKDKNGKPASEVCTRESVANALLDMAILGLNPAKQQGYFIAYGNQLTWFTSYFGNIAAAQRLKKVESLPVATLIYDGDEVIIDHDELGQEVIASHKTTWENKQKAIVGAYATIKFDGAIRREVMTMKEIKEAWGQSKTNREHAVFTGEFAKRTVFNRLMKRILKTSNDDDLVAETLIHSEEQHFEFETDNVIETVKADVKKETASVQPPKVEEEPHDTPPEGQTNLFVDEPGF
jgi:recombination protein RecT